MNDFIKKQILERDKFTCQKCRLVDKTGEELEVHHILPKIFEGIEEPSNLITLCSICHRYSPDSKEDFLNYIKEKVDWKILETFRKSHRSISKRTWQGMSNHFKQGMHLSKAPLGYRLYNKQLIIDPENMDKVRNLFKTFAEFDMSLTQLAQKNSLTTSGLIKLLSNKTYLGKIKFGEQETEGTHQPIIETEIFDKVQKKLAKMRAK